MSDKAIYRGFSSANWIKNKSFTVTNIDLVKQDLLNHIWTRKGERVMMPGFGTRIPLMVFEQNDETTRAIIEEDLRQVFTYDPRVELLDLRIVSLPDNNAIMAVVDLLYIEFNVKDILKIEVKTT